jgi:hypothetical protein
MSLWIRDCLLTRDSVDDGGSLSLVDGKEWLSILEECAESDAQKLVSPPPPRLASP